MSDTKVASSDNPKSSGADNVLTSAVDVGGARFAANREAMRALLASLRAEEDAIRQGGGAKAVEAEHAKRRRTARERIALLLDAGTGTGTQFYELGLHAAHG